ncbi:MAG: UDP-N-acetylmuramoyl-L-alanyl-D-glutamate--2,6-diaminopimelate ligase, partial [Xanthomonadales bacterium]|nr:UDP-N-acetylmuramoyl-L-alanyl-D-glutamate--2,6-diaminopimelate ligase [Xanthomonadales bacterium]
MSLASLLEGWCESPPQVILEGLGMDSRRILPGEAFVAVKGGSAHGMQYAAQAEAKGARVVIHDGLADVPALGIPTVRVEHLGRILSALA